MKVATCTELKISGSYSLLWSMYFCGSKISGFIRRTVESLFALQV